MLTKKDGCGKPGNRYDTRRWWTTEYCVEKRIVLQPRD